MPEEDKPSIYIHLAECEDPPEPTISEVPLKGAISMFCENTTSHGFKHLFYIEKKDVTKQIPFMLVLFLCVCGAFFSMCKTPSLAIFSPTPSSSVSIQFFALRLILVNIKFIFSLKYS